MSVIMDANQIKNAAKLFSIIGCVLDFHIDLRKNKKKTFFFAFGRLSKNILQWRIQKKISLGVHQKKNLAAAQFF